MKKIFLYIAITLGLLSCNHKDSLWQEVVEDLDERVETLEMLCAEMNTNIASLQTIVDVLQSNDFITSIVEIKKDGKVVGYTITFGKHDPITIYHGQDGKDGQNGTNGKDGQDGADGKDGQNGTDGKDGITPVIGVAQDTDGVYYWTLNGEWLLDDNGNKLPVSGKDGQNGTNGSNGQDGADGKDGADGQDGKDGITPQLKIEDGYWYISYDNGATWTQLGKATGEDGKDGVDGENGKDGQNGADGKDGQDGDSMFQSVIQDENYVYFTLADGTVIKIAKGNDSSINKIEGQLDGIFSVSKYDKVNFSRGNLLYNPALDIWKFTEMQHDWYNQDNTIAATDSVWMDLFTWGCTGYKFTPLIDKAYYFYSYEQAGIIPENFDWGVFCPIRNGGNQRNQWRTLTREEWIYVINERNDADKLRANAIVNDIKGFILFPDTSTIAINNPNILVSGQSYSIDRWQILEKQGCIFFPNDNYWTSTPSFRYVQYGTQGYHLVFIGGCYINLSTCNTGTDTGKSTIGYDRYYTEKHSVRLVRNICEK